MRFMTAMKKPLLASVAAASLLTSGMVTAEVVDEKPSAGAMVVDAVFVRPLYFILSQAGSLVYGATLPFTLLGENATDAAETLVVTPLQGAFVRCLGCGDIDNEVAALEEGKGKTIRHFATVSAGYTEHDDDAVEDLNGSTGGGLYLGTHFSLSDTSRFDVMLGYRTFGSVKQKDTEGKFEDTINSIQIVSRFGKQIFWDLELMGKLGLHSWKSTRSQKGESDSSVSGKGFFYGVGVDKFIGDNVRVGLEYTIYPLDDIKTDLSSSDLNISYMF